MEKSCDGEYTVEAVGNGWLVTFYTGLNDKGYRDISAQSKLVFTDSVALAEFFAGCHPDFQPD